MGCDKTVHCCCVQNRPGEQLSYAAFEAPAVGRCYYVEIWKHRCGRSVFWKLRIGNTRIQIAQSCSTLKVVEKIAEEMMRVIGWKVIKKWNRKGKDF